MEIPESCILLYYAKFSNTDIIKYFFRIVKIKDLTKLFFNKKFIILKLFKNINIYHAARAFPAKRSCVPRETRPKVWEPLVYTLSIYIVTNVKASRIKLLGINH